MVNKPKLGMKDICQFLGISSTTIRIYEKHLQERRYDVLDSGHRKFTGASLLQLYDLRYMSKSGLSIKEAAIASQGGDVDERVDLYIKGEQELKGQIRYLQASLEEVEETKRLLEQLTYGKASFSVANVPGFYFLECERNGRLLSSPAEKELMASWASMMPAVYYMNRDIVEGPDAADWSYRIGLAISEKNSSLVPVDHKAVSYYPARRCVVGVIVDENEESLAAEDYQFSGKCVSLDLEYLDKQELALSGQVFNRFIGSMMDVRDARGSAITGGLWYGMYPIA